MQTKSLSSLTQGTTEWLDWRKQGIGASEMAAIIGVCPYSTPYKVWLEKTGRAQGFVGNFATQRGTELESKARARYELLSMEDMPPALAVHPKYEIVRVSLDGFRADGKKILEIKCLGKDSHALVVSGVVPTHYIPQVQYQLLATGADSCDFFSFGADESHGLIEVLPDLEYQAMLIASATAFWESHIKKDVAPPLTADDVKIVTDGEVAEICNRLATEKDKLHEKLINQLKEKIILLGGHNKIRCGKVLVTVSKTKAGADSYRLTIAKDD